MNRIFPIALALLAMPAAATAQQAAAPGDLVDRIVAVVGDSVVLQTDVDEQLLDLAASGQPIPEDPESLARLRRQVLELKINELLLVQAAVRDSMVISADEVAQSVERELAARLESFGSQRVLEQALAQRGLTLPEYRAELERDYRRQLLVRNYLQSVQRNRRPPPVTEDQLRTFFERQRDQFGQRPATVTFRQVVLGARPSESARAAARQKAEEVLALVRGGEDFEQLARRFSNDPSSRERGGDLGWFRRGQMVRTFEDAAFALSQGQYSGLVESPYGFHIIKVEKVRGPERQARHILIQPELSAADAERARVLADSAAAAARAGASMQELYQRLGDPTEDERVGPFPRDRLPEPYTSQLATAQQGDVVGPFELPATTAGQPGKWALVKVEAVSPSGDYTFDDPFVRTQLKQALERDRLIDELVRELRRATFVDVRI